MKKKCMYITLHACNITLLVYVIIMKKHWCELKWVYLAYLNLEDQNFYTGVFFYLKSDNSRVGLTFATGKLWCLNPSSGRCWSMPRTLLVASFNSLPLLSGSKVVNFLFTDNKSFSFSIPKFPYKYGLLGSWGTASWKPRRRCVASALWK